MALTFPRDLPGCAFRTQSWKPRYQQATSLTGGGTPNVLDLGPMLWEGQWDVATRGREEAAIWSAWLLSLRGGLKTFKGRPPYARWLRSYPRGYTGLLYSGSQWSGLGNLSAIGAGRDTCTVNNIPNSLLFKVGDWLSIPVGSFQHLHRVMEDATSAANAVTLTVEPVLRPAAVTAVAVKLFEPYCDMVLVDAPSQSIDSGREGAFSFSGLQVLV